MAETFAVDFSDVKDDYYVEPGLYQAQCIDVKKDKKPDGEYPYLIWEFKLKGGKTIFYNTSLAPKALFSLYGLLGALLNKTIPKSAVKISPASVKGKWCTVEVADREYNGKTYSNVVKTMPLSKSAVADEEIAEGEEDDLL